MVAYQELNRNEVLEISQRVRQAMAILDVSLSELARRAGVAQSMAHGVLNAKFQKRTPNLKRLELYVHIVLGMRDMPDLTAIDDAVLTYLGTGGDVAELRRLIAAYAQMREASA